MGAGGASLGDREGLDWSRWVSPFPCPGKPPPVPRECPKTHSPEIVLLILTKIFSKSAKSLQDDWNMCMKRLMNRFSILQIETWWPPCTRSGLASPCQVPLQPGLMGPLGALNPGQLQGAADWPCGKQDETGTHAHVLPSALP